MSDGRTPTGSGNDQEAWQQAQREAQARRDAQAQREAQAQRDAQAQREAQARQPSAPPVPPAPPQSGQPQAAPSQWAPGNRAPQQGQGQYSQGQYNPGQQSQGQYNPGQQSQGQYNPSPQNPSQQNHNPYSQGQGQGQSRSGQQDRPQASTYRPTNPSSASAAPTSAPSSSTPQPTQQYPHTTAPTGSTAATERFAPVHQSPVQQGPVQQGPGYPVQYAAGPGQQHSTSPYPTSTHGDRSSGQQNTEAFAPYAAGAGHQNSDRAAKKRRFAWGTAITAALVGAAAATLITLVVSGQFVRPVFTGAAVEEGVQSVLEDEFGLADVQDVTCPEEPSASAGAEFACGFTTGDREFSVQIRVLDSGGQYLVGAVSTGD